MSSSSWNGSKHTSAFLYYIFMVVFLVLTITKSKYWSALQMLKRGWEDGSLFVTVFATQVWGPESDAQNLAGYVRQPPKFPAVEGEALEKLTAREAISLSFGFDWQTLPRGLRWKSNGGRFLSSTFGFHICACTHTHTRNCKHVWMYKCTSVCSCKCKSFHTHTCMPHSTLTRKNRKKKNRIKIKINKHSLICKFSLIFNKQ